MRLEDGTPRSSAATPAGRTRLGRIELQVSYKPALLELLAEGLELRLEVFDLGAQGRHFLFQLNDAAALGRRADAAEGRFLARERGLAGQQVAVARLLGAGRQRQARHQR